MFVYSSLFLSLYTYVYISYIHIYIDVYVYVYYSVIIIRPMLATEMRLRMSVTAQLARKPDNISGEAGRASSGSRRCSPWIRMGAAMRG